MNRAEHGGTVLYGRSYKGGAFLPFYVPRELMPQVDAVDQPKMVKDAVLAQLGVQFVAAPVIGVRAHQRIDKRRAVTMPEEVRRKPIILSSDGYILDGNHRWYAHVAAKEHYINAILISLTFDAGIDWLNSLSYVYQLNRPNMPERN